MTIPLRHGMFLAPFHSITENPTLALERDLRLCEWLDELGFQESWISEHHSAGLEIIDSPVVTTSILLEASDMRFNSERAATGTVSSWTDGD
jgi:limonene 1,2-monooxygenase